MKKIKQLGIIIAVFGLVLGSVTYSAAEEKGLIGYWSFDEIEGDIVKDSSGKGNHGKLCCSGIHGKVDVGGSETLISKKFRGKDGCFIGWELKMTRSEGNEGEVRIVSGFNAVSHTLTFPAFDYDIIAGDKFFLSNGKIPAIVDGRFGKCGDFSEPHAYIELGLPDGHPTKDFTITSWIKLGSDFRYIARIMGKAGTSPDFLVFRNSRLRARLFNDPKKICEFEGDTRLDPGKWYFAAMVYNGSELKLYLNGKEDGSKPFSGSIPHNQWMSYQIGGYHWVDGSAHFFNGFIDEVRFYNRALTPLEIQTLYKNVTDEII